MNCILMVVVVVGVVGSSSVEEVLDVVGDVYLSKRNTEVIYTEP